MSTLFVSTNRNVPFQIYMFHMAAVGSNGRYQQKIILVILLVIIIVI